MLVEKVSIHVCLVDQKHQIKDIFILGVNTFDWLLILYYFFFFVCLEQCSEPGAHNLISVITVYNFLGLTSIYLHCSIITTNQAKEKWKNELTLPFLHVNKYQFEKKKRE